MAAKTVRANGGRAGCDRRGVHGSKGARETAKPQRWALSETDEVGTPKQQIVLCPACARSTMAKIARSVTGHRPLNHTCKLRRSRAQVIGQLGNGMFRPW